MYHILILILDLHISNTIYIIQFGDCADKKEIKMYVKFNWRDF